LHHREINCAKDGKDTNPIHKKNFYLEMVKHVTNTIVFIEIDQQYNPNYEKE